MNSRPVPLKRSVRSCLLEFLRQGRVAGEVAVLEQRRADREILAAEPMQSLIVRLAWPTFSFRSHRM